MTPGRIIWVEGYDDRAFVGPLLERMGCVSMKAARPMLDQNGQTVPPGQFLFQRPSGIKDLRIVCGNSRSQVVSKARQSIKDGNHAVVVSCVDDDALVLSGPGGGLASTATTAVSIAGVDWTKVANCAADALEKDGVSLAIAAWRCDDDENPGIPSKQTLERLVCASLSAVYPLCAAYFPTWLACRPPGGPIGGMGSGHKPHAWSWFAGWFAEVHTAEDFYRAVWDDQDVAAELENRLTASGAWDAFLLAIK